MSMRALSVAVLAAGAAVAGAWGQPGEPIAAAGTQRERPPIMIGGVEYRKLGTREETERRVLDLLAPARVKWGAWYGLGSFEHRDWGDLRKALAPEEELGRMRAGGPGPDLARTYPAAGGTTAGWKALGERAGELIRFEEFTPAAHHENVSGYVYTTATVEKAMALDVTMGSDDGLRFWFNGRLLVDVDEGRSLDASEHAVRLDLKAGVNHLLAKVSQGNGDWQYQLIHQGIIDPTLRQLLDYHLDVDFPPTPEAEYYRAFPVVLPPEVVLEAGGVAMMPDGRPVVSTRRGEVYIVEGAYDEPPTACGFRRFAAGLHEPLGVAVREEEREGKKIVAVYCVQRGELTRMVDTDGDQRADVYETVCDGWGVSGNYHEFAFGPKFDGAGNAWVTLNVGFCDSLGKSLVPYRGWALRVDPAGRVTPVCGGLRSPNGIGFWSDGQAFYLDNQGDYVGTNRLAPLVEGGWAGHPSGLRWRGDYSKAMDNPSNYPAMTPAAVWFPYKKMGQSVADFLLAAPSAGAKAGAFGPWDGQVFVGDQTLCMVMRVTMEKVGGVYQGACYPFRQGLQCGVNRLAWGKDGSMFVGQTDRGWGSIGRARYGLERLVWTGKAPFEVLSARVVSGGFELVFTGDVDVASAGSVGSYGCVSYTYEYHPQYGSEEMGVERPRVVGVEVVGPRTVRLRVEGVRSGGMGYVHEISCGGVRSAGEGGEGGAGVLHPVSYVTVQKVPG